MSYASDRLREFHEAFEVDVPESAKYGVEYDTAVIQRKTLHEEERAEVDEAFDSLGEMGSAVRELVDAGGEARQPRAHLAHLAEELADEMILLYGDADLLGIDLDVAFRLKMDGNMAKLPDCPNPRCDGGDVPGGPKGYLLCPDCGGSGRGKPLKREDGKILKGEHWQKPSMAEAIKHG